KLAPEIGVVGPAIDDRQVLPENGIEHRGPVLLVLGDRVCLLPDSLRGVAHQNDPTKRQAAGVRERAKSAIQHSAQGTPRVAAKAEESRARAAAAPQEE